VESASDPPWLAEWLRHRTDCGEAQRRFESLAPIEPDELLGRWRGTSCPTGHALDGLLEALGWYGKAFEPPDRAHPLLFRTGSGRLVALDPSFLPVGVPLRWPVLARSAPARAAFAATRPLLTTRRPAARVRRVEHCGVASATMIYDRQPITDHFRRLAPDKVLGLMEMPGERPYYFLLVRD